MRVSGEHPAWTYRIAKGVTQGKSGLQILPIGIIRHAYNGTQGRGPAYPALDYGQYFESIVVSNSKQSSCLFVQRAPY